MKLYKDKTFLTFGIVAGLVSLLVYLLTKAPTLSFWDCGEFIACAKILGVPHPPGTPLYTLIGRFFILLPLTFNDAAKINLISVLSSVAAIYIAYWLIIRLIIGFEKEITDFWQKIALAVGGFAGSLIMGFSSTFWDNAIEAEVYGLSMMLMLLLSYMLLMWGSRIGKPGAGKLLVAISYIAFLSIGIHLTVFLIMPIFVLYMAIKDRSLMYDWRFWITWMFLLMITGYLDGFLYGLAGLVIVSAVFLITSKQKPYMLKWVFAISVAAVLGYSTHLYIPIRANQKPAINENNPDNWQRFKSLLERKQYGQESMATRMFSRRGTWANQFGTHKHMGLWGYFRDQYSERWATFLFFAIGLWGIYEAIRRDKLNGLWLLALFLVSTVGLVLYLNFSDGTRGAILEVRNRDYFFTPGFMYFGVLIGVGLSGLLYDLANWTKNHPERHYLLVGALVITMLFPLHTIKANYFEHDRSRKYIPWDYAYNILNSVDENGIVFTNGDNDTFPLWCLQQVDGVRTDVRIVNLSLLNTPWYIHQLKDEMGVPINLTYDQIENLRPVWDPDKEKVWKVQDEMIKHIITANKWKIPIFFAVTVSHGNKLNLEKNMIMQGMAYKIVPDKGHNRVYPEKMWELYMEKFKFRGLNDTTIFKNENDNRLVANYVSGFLQLADTLKKVGEYDKAITVAEKSLEIFPNEWRHRAYLSGLYADVGKFDEIDKIIEGVSPNEIAQIYNNAAQQVISKEQWEEGSMLLRKSLEYEPKSLTAFSNLMVAENTLGNYDNVDSLAQYWSEINKNDPKALANLDNLVRALESRRQQQQQ
ncbi:MAG: DUF2723 domain-containing protein [candidate division Zixibacteria bacterium]|nr:DUF2723 domain-containing protein [candidate division Zixibacteria bacterium]